MVEEEDENIEGRKRDNESDEGGRAKRRQVILLLPAAEVRVRRNKLPDVVEARYVRAYKTEV